MLLAHKPFRTSCLCRFENKWNKKISVHVIIELWLARYKYLSVCLYVFLFNLVLSNFCTFKDMIYWSIFFLGFFSMIISGEKSHSVFFLFCLVVSFDDTWTTFEWFSFGCNQIHISRINQYGCCDVKNHGKVKSVDEEWTIFSLVELCEKTSQCWSCFVILSWFSYKRTLCTNIRYRSRRTWYARFICDNW